MRALLAFFFLLSTAFAQHENVARGRTLFVKHCSACHGDNAKGGRASDLTTGQYKHGSSDEALVRNIRQGIAGTQMPPIRVEQDEALAIVAFLRSTSAKVEPVPGDPLKGRDVFVASCSKCHMFSGHGGRLGPDLTAVRNRRQPSQVRKALEQPLKFVSVHGRKGVIRHEDTFTLLYMDENEALHSIDKATAKVTRSEAAHPAIPDDAMAFLFKHDPLPPPAWKPSAEFNVTYQRLLNAAKEPQNWLHYWGNYAGTHHSPLTQLTPANTGQLKNLWTFQQGGQTVETSPLVVDGWMFVTGPLNNAAALDARTGAPLWRYTRRLPEVASHCTVMTNRGFAMLGDRLYMATLDSHLVALDAKTGNVIWETEVADYRKGFSITHAPLAVDNMILVGLTAGECALSGALDAYDATTGKRLWRTYAVAQPGDPNRASWSPARSADFGGSPTWMTGTYDPETDTVFWMTGNPGPDYDGSVRGGDNLYSNCVLALDRKTGKIKWYFQYTPHDVHDWDATETPVLIDGVVRGQKRKLLISAQRNAFYYVLDRTTGEFLSGRAFARQTWAKGLDDKGRPIVLPNTTPTTEGNYVCPDAAGSTNWGAPSYDPATNFFLVSVRDACATYFAVTKTPVPGEGFTGGGQELDPKIGTPGSIRALDALTGQQKWDFPIHSGHSAPGVLSTAGGVTFAGSHDGYLLALDTRTGKLLWKYNTGAQLISKPVTYMVNGRQHVAIASQSAVFVFGL